MTRRYLALCCWLLCLFTLAGCVSPFREVDRVGEYTPEIDPQAGNRSGGTITADLWLPVKSRDYFAVKTFSVAVASGGRPEMAVLKGLGRRSRGTFWWPPCGAPFRCWRLPMTTRPFM